MKKINDFGLKNPFYCKNKHKTANYDDTKYSP